MTKKQTIKQIKFRAQYLFLIQEMLDNARFFKKQYHDICLIDTGFFSKKVLKLVEAEFNCEVSVVNVKDIKQMNAKSYDLILAPLSLQYLLPLKYSISVLHDALKSDGIVLASAFNVLQSSDSILDLKAYISENKLRAGLINFFELGQLCNNFSFIDKSLDRENLLIQSNQIEVINLCCRKKQDENTENGFKIVIN
jgi:hypothetical protein